MAEFDYEPFECEAFLGMEFHLEGDREQVFVCASNPDGKDNTKLLSIHRKGFLQRHSFRTQFPQLLPDRNGLIPLTEEAAAERRRPAVAANPSGSGMIQHPSLPLQFCLIQAGSAIALASRDINGDEAILLGITRHGKVSRTGGIPSRMAEGLRRNGITLSRDNRIAVENPLRQAQYSEADPFRPIDLGDRVSSRFTSILSGLLEFMASSRGHLIDMREAMPLVDRVNFDYDALYNYLSTCVASINHSRPRDPEGVRYHFERPPETEDDSDEDTDGEED